MYTKQFEIRWSDLDANKHLANSAYTNFMSYTRMAFFVSHGFTMEALSKYSLGPVVFYEHMYYFKEAFLGERINVSLEVCGLSEDGMFFKFEHNFYNASGKNIAHCEILGAWIDSKTRKLIGIPNALSSNQRAFPKSKNFKILTKEDTRVYGKKPEHLI